MGAAGQSTGYEIDQSIRFNNDDSPVMSRSFGTPTDRNKFTYAFWIKSTSQAGGYNLGINVTGGVTFAGMVFNGNNMAFYDYTSGSASIDVRSTFTSDVGKFQDYSAWYHAVFAYDSDQGTDTDRIKFYINGVQFPVASLVGPSGGSVVWPSSGFNSQFNASGTTHTISDNVNGKLDGYMAEIYFIDGQALEPTSFGEFNPSGVFVPIEYSGAFGDNGFFIDGRDSSDLGDDESGNGNDFSTSGLTTSDQVIDSPTNNMPILNFLSKGTGTLSDGNLQYTGVSGNWSNARVNLLVPDTGKWALRMKSADSYQQILVGLCAPDSACPYTDIDVNGVAQIRYNTFDGNFVTRVTGSLVNDTGAPTTAAQTFFQLLFDMDNGKMGVAADDATSGTFADISTYSALDLNGASLKTARQPFVQAYSGVSSGAGVIIDAGQSGWTTTVTGFKNLILANLPTPAISDGSKHFDTKLWTGNDTDGRAITGYNFSPDWVWIKSRSGAYSHNITDTVRGVGNYIQSNTNDAEVDGPGAFGSTLAFTSDGFTLDNGTSDNLFVNAGGETYAGWAWEGNGSGSSNTDGDITSTVSANTTSGFSILTYTGNGSDNQEIGHGIGIAPKMIFSKRRDASSSNWTMYHDAVGINQVMYLNLTNLPASNTEQYRATPTSSVYTVGVGGDINASSGTYVAYCFAEVEGFSKMGSYVANASTDGPFVYCGFLPAFVIFFSIAGSSAGRWMLDGTRSSFNAADKIVQANSHGAESSGTSYELDFVSNGFKIRTASDFNSSGRTIAYAAFAKHPFGGDSTAPVTGGFLSS